MGAPGALGESVQPLRVSRSWEVSGEPLAPKSEKAYKYLYYVAFVSSAYDCGGYKGMV